jgi:hypothetical protein
MFFISSPYMRGRGPSLWGRIKVGVNITFNYKIKLYFYKNSPLSLALSLVGEREYKIKKTFALMQMFF